MKRHQVAHTIAVLLWLGMAAGFMGSMDYGLLDCWAAFGLGLGSIAMMGLHIWALETIRTKWTEKEDKQ